MPFDDSRLLIAKATADALASAASLDEAAVSVLQAVCVPMEWQRGELWVVEHESQTIRLQWSWHDPAAGQPGMRYDADRRGAALAAGEGLAGQVWRTGSAAIAADLSRDPGSVRHNTATASGGLRGAVGVPIRAAGDVIGVLAFYSHRVREANAQAMTILGIVATQIGLLLHRRPEQARPEISDDELAHRLETERQAREVAERESRMKDEFLATASHQLRTPLNAILGWAQVLRGVRDLAEVNEAVGIIERNARVQARLIGDLLDISRIVSGQVQLETERVELDQVVEAAIDAILPEASNRRIRIETSIEPFAAPVMGDPNRLQQIVWNMLSNAVKYTSDGGRVRVTLDADDADAAEAVVTVCDNGMGIDPEVLPHVFERFKRPRPVGGAGAKGGLGLGLAVAKHLAELHGGTVRAESAGLGQGSTFIVTLPLAVLFDGAAGGATARSGRRNGNGAGATFGEHARPVRLDGVAILVVDDESDTRRFLERILHDSGASVVTADSMDQALGALDATAFDLLVSDIGMPDHDGYELIHRVRQRSADKGGLIRALALTAFAGESDLRRSLGAGFNMHINKPVDADDLLAAIGRLLGPKLQTPAMH